MADLAELHIDQLQPFLLNNAAVRGRIVRLGAAVDTILTRHAYPEPVSRLLAEVLCIASILAANLKHEGIITIQMRGNGPVRLLVVDASAEQVGEEGQVSAIALRGYADLAAGAESLASNATPREIMGEDSYFAITYDPGRGMQRYQGVVGLEGGSLTEALSVYFTQSQQLDVSFRLAVDRIDAGWVAGGIMIERVASEGGAAADTDTHEAWRTALAYTATLAPAEMLDIELPLTDLLFRLFHETGVRVTPTVELSARCRCSRERIHGVLMSMSAEERADMVVDGVVSVHCQFCNGTELFTPSDLELSFNQ